MARSNITTASWDGDRLIINWFGVPAHPNDTGARWSKDRLIFEGLAESKGWKLEEKPTAEEALALIVRWQRGG